MGRLTRTRRSVAAASCVLACLFAETMAASRVAAQAPSANASASALSGRGPSVERLRVWADAVRVHQPNTFDASAAGVAAWSPAQLTDLQIELTNLLVLMEHPQQRQFWLQDARRNLITILYNDGEVDSLRQLARSVGGRDPVAPDTEQERRRVAAARARLLDRGAILHTDIARLSTPGAAPDAAPGNARRNPTSGSGVIEFYDGQVIGVFRSSNQWTVARDLLDRATRTPS